MRVRSSLAALLTVIIFSSTASASPSGRTVIYRKALDLYENSQYQAARNLFEKISGDAVPDGYVVLCALKMRSADSQDLLSLYRKSHPSSSLLNDAVFANALNLFDDGKYEESLDEFLFVKPSALLNRELPQYWFKKGYSEYSLGKYPEAISSFEKLESLPATDFTSFGYYLHGVILYNQKRFGEAVPMFDESVRDIRFAELSRFYIVDCEFNQKNYDYVIREGEAMYASAPKERQEHLARIISESYLVKGDKEKAREYFEGTYHTDLTRSDIFYSGEVLYAVEDYAGAIEQFCNMKDRSDSLGQIANYHLGYSYVRTRNKVAAMAAFEDAAEVGFDRNITEDALFNYAKLAFDINKDTNGFAEYIKRYFTKTKGEMIYSYMALAGLNDRDYAGAVAAYDNIDELGDDMKANYTKANFLRAVQLMKNGSYSDAIPFLRTTGYYLGKNDRFGQLSRYWLAESYYRTGNYKEAERNYLDLYNSDALYDKPEGKALPYNLAYSYLKQNNYDSAAKWFDVYVNSGDKTFRKDARYRRADCDFLSGSYKQAVNAYKDVLDEYPAGDDLYALYRMAMSQGLSNNKKAKVSTLSKAESADSTANMYSECLYELGNTRYELKSYTAAEKTFQQLASTAPNDVYAAKALLGLGKVRRSLGKTDDALESYMKAAFLLPGSEYADEADKAIESLYKAAGQTEKYQEYLKRSSIDSLSVNDRLDNINFNTAEQIFKSGDYAQATVYLQKYLDDFPAGINRTEAKYHLAESFIALGDKERAASLFSQVAETGPVNDFSLAARMLYADLMYELERFSDSYKAYASLLSLAKNSDVSMKAKLGMMRSSFRDRNYSAAIESASDILSSNSKDEGIVRETSFVKAKSLFNTSRRDEALSIFRTLADKPSTQEGAEARYILMSDAFDRADFEVIESLVYDFAEKAGDQSHWLAKAYVLLADSFVERGDYQQAKATYESVRDGYEAVDGIDEIEDNVNLKLSRLAELMK